MRKFRKVLLQTRQITKTHYRAFSILITRQLPHIHHTPIRDEDLCGWYATRNAMRTIHLYCLFLCIEDRNFTLFFVL